MRYDTNLLSEEVRLGLDKEIAPDGTYLAYFPFGAMIERSRMTPYHNKFSIAVDTMPISVIGSKRATTLPWRSTRNLVKFHLISGFEA